MTDMTQEYLVRIRRLCDESDIQALLATYSNAVDWLDWAALESVFWPEAVLDYGLSKGDLATAMAFVTSLEEGYRRRLHMFGMSHIQLKGDQARAEVCSVTVTRTDNDGGGVDDFFWGRYIFTAERRGTEWRLSGLKYLLNLIESQQRDSDDGNGPLKMADDLSTHHPMAPAASR